MHHLPLALRITGGALKQLIIIHTDDYQNWKLGNSHPTSGSRYINALKLILETAAHRGIDLEVREPSGRDIRPLLESIHDPEYVGKVIDRYECSQWDGVNVTLARLSQLLASGTLDALDTLLLGETLTAVHLPGAKHHAQRDYGSGYCVFADFALAAKIATERNLKVAILDFDAHHGDGTENLTRDNPNVLTYSIHEWGIFPGTGVADDAENFVYNRPLDRNATTGQTLIDLCEEFCELAKDFKADVAFIAAGADGHLLDPLANLPWVSADYVAANQLIRESMPTMPILVGGAGGYRPDDATPETWRDVVLSIAS